MNKQNKDLKISEQSYIITNPNIAGNVKDAYISLSDNIRFLLTPVNGKIIAVTSKNEEEGKSTFAVNLAITLAQRSAKVLLVDTNMRNPSIHKKLKLRNTKGFSTFVAGFDSLSDVLKRDVVPGLDVITSGIASPDPYGLIKSENTKVFFEKIQEYYDYVIIDTAALSSGIDVTALPKLVSGVVITTKYASTSYRDIEKTKFILDESDMKILGFVITEKIYRTTDEFNAKHFTQTEEI